MNITVRDPDPHHNHWGIEIRFEADEDCTTHVHYAMELLKRFEVFHQGGHHARNERCGKWHYFEMWGLPGHQDHRDTTLQMIEEIRTVEFQDWQFFHKCTTTGCTTMVEYDDEPWCFTHSPDEGSSQLGYSARAQAKAAAQR